MLLFGIEVDLLAAELHFGFNGFLGITVDLQIGQGTHRRDHLNEPVFLRLLMEFNYFRG